MKNYVIAAIILVVMGYAFGRYMQPAKVEVKEVEVVKQVTTENKNIVVTQVETVNKDGTKTIKTVTEDKSTTKVQENRTTESDKITSSQKPQWKVSGLAGVKIDDLKSRLVYGAAVERRILGPVFVGVWGNTERMAGVTVGLEF